MVTTSAEAQAVELYGHQMRGIGETIKANARATVYRLGESGVTFTLGEGTVLPDDVFRFTTTKPVMYTVSYERGRPPNRHERRAAAARRRAHR